MQKETLKDLLDQYITGVISAEGKLKLLEMLEQPEGIDQLEGLMKESFSEDRFTVEEEPALRLQIQNWLQKEINPQRSPLRMWKGIRWMAAAVVIFFVCLGTYLLFSDTKKEVAVLPKTELTDIKAPLENRATIRLSNGKQVFLDELQNGAVANEANVNLVKLADGKVLYKGKADKLVYNTLYNPKGSNVISVVLSDGTNVVLDAGSSLHYPVYFVGAERKVHLTGQAWFQVTHKEEQPFKVVAKRTETMDLGTVFNINAFDDEPVVRATLIEGSVKMMVAKEHIVLKPGQQGRASKEQIEVHAANLDDVTAWKSGFFSFRHSRISQIMRELSRWYDVEVRYEHTMEEQEFTGKIDRNLSLQEVLKILNRTRVNFKMEGEKKILIVP